MNVMQQDIWFTPEGIEDLLPQQAEKLEYYRQGLLNELKLSGYQQVLPPLLSLQIHSLRVRVVNWRLIPVVLLIMKQVA